MIVHLSFPRSSQFGQLIFDQLMPVFETSGFEIDIFNSRLHLIKINSVFSSENWQKKFPLFFRSEKKDSDLCRKRLEETTAQNVTLKEKFHKYKIEKETELEKMKQTLAGHSEKTDVELLQLRKSNKELQREVSFISMAYFWKSSSQSTTLQDKPGVRPA